MAKAKSTAPVVHLSRVAGRPIQMWYLDARDRKVRRSAKTYDLGEAEDERRKWEATLVLGLPETDSGKLAGPGMAWDDFREEYRRKKLVTMKNRGAQEAELRLDLAAKIVGPKTLCDMADALDRLQADLLRGKCGRYKIKVDGREIQRPRSPASVRSTMRTVIAALNWATKKPRQWLQNVPRIDLMRVDVSDEMKGRPLVGEELDRFYAAIEKVVPKDHVAAWTFFVKCVVASGLRLSELMAMTWDQPHTIRPVFRKGALPEIFLPAHLQKNSKRETIPMTPWLAELLGAIPEDQRTGYVFHLPSRRPPFARLKEDRVGKLLTAIGRRAGIIVDEGDPRTGSKVKYASCHDLRRTFATKLAEAKVDPRIIQTVMRHSSIAVTERYYISTRTQQDAGNMWDTLGHDRDSCVTREMTGEGAQYGYDARERKSYAV